MKRLSTKFRSEAALNNLIAEYFNINSITKKSTEKEISKEIGIKNKKPESDPTITGLALHLGFNSRDEFDKYEQKGKFAALLKRARLRIEAIYENKLHHSSPYGAIFALKSMGWNEKVDTGNNGKTSSTLKIKIVKSGPKPASNEKEVKL